MSLKDILARYWRGFQPELFEALETELGPLGARYERLIPVFESSSLSRSRSFSGPDEFRSVQRRIVSRWRAPSLRSRCSACRRPVT